MSADPWSAFLEWLTTVLVPNWGELIGLMPYVLIGTLVGPLLTLLALAWLWHYATRRRGRVRRGEAQAAPAPRGDDGLPTFPPNVPYCEEHALIYPPRVHRCDIDHAGLQVACPVDGTVRDAAIEVCSACGTKFELGATARATVVSPPGGPPQGGAAIA